MRAAITLALCVSGLCQTSASTFAFPISDWIIVAPDSLADIAGTIADHRTSVSGLNTGVVLLSEICEGTPDAECLRQYLLELLTAYHPPIYVVLLGEGNRRVPEYELVPTTWLYGRYFSLPELRPYDGPFRDPDGDGVADFIVGRIPVRSRDHAQTYLDKLVSAADMAADAQASRFIQVIGDVGPDDYGYMAEAAEGLAAHHISDGWDVTVLRRSDYPADDGLGNPADAALYGAIAAGATWFHGYGQTGGGDVMGFLNYGLYDTATLEALPEEGRLLAAFLSSCEGGQFAREIPDSLGTPPWDWPGEELLLDAPNGWRFCAGFSGHVTSETAHVFADGALRAMAAGLATSTGAVAEAARAALLERYDLVTEAYPMEWGVNILGDPAIPVLPSPDPTRPWREGFELSDGFAWRIRLDPDGDQGIGVRLRAYTHSLARQQGTPPPCEGHRAIRVETQALQPHTTLSTFHACDLRRYFLSEAMLLLTWETNALRHEGSLWIAPELVLSDGSRLLETFGLCDLEGNAWPHFPVDSLGGWRQSAVLLPENCAAGERIGHLSLRVAAEASDWGSLDSCAVLLDHIRLRPILPDQNATLLNASFEEVSPARTAPFDWTGSAEDQVGVVTGVCTDGEGSLLIRDSGSDGAWARGLVVKGRFGERMDGVLFHAKGEPGTALDVRCLRVGDGATLGSFRHVLESGDWELVMDIFGASIDEPLVILELSVSPGDYVLVDEIVAWQDELVGQDERVAGERAALEDARPVTLDVHPAVVSPRFTFRWATTASVASPCISIFDARGRLVGRWAEESHGRTHAVGWPTHGSRVASGVYFLVATWEGGRQVKRLTLVR